MIRNYFIVAIRNILRQRGYSFINIFGLAVGLACFILILLFVQHELSYDRFYGNADHIYRVVKRHPGGNFHGLDSYAVTAAPLAAALLEEFPEITAATTIDERNDLLSFGNKHFWEEGIAGDAHFFDVFNFPMLRGNPKTALGKPKSIILSRSLAIRLFPDRDPMGQIILVNQNGALYSVTGVIPDVPVNSSIKYTFIISIQSQPDYVGNLAENRWNSANYYTFFLLAGGADVSQLQVRMPALVKKYVPEAGNNPNKNVQFIIQALSDIHLHSRFNFDLAFTGDIKNVYLFSAIGFLILLLACVNYTNLAIARSIRRTREVGIRKVVGAWRHQLIAQFLGESVLMVFLALMLAFGLVDLLLPYFGRLMERPLHLDFLGNGPLLPGLMALVATVGLLSGSYPAFIMASLQPMQVLAGKRHGRDSRFRVQRLLIVGQFAVSITLVAGSFVVYRQMQYVQHKDIGYNRENVVTVRVKDEALRENYTTIHDEWLTNPHVIAVASSSDLPTFIVSGNGISGLEGSSAGDRMEVYITYGDYDFLDVFGIKLVAGRAFSREISSDALGAALINETAVRTLGWTPEEAVGKTFIHNSGERTIVGVVKDFHMHSMHMPIEPLVIRLDPGRIGYISAKVRADNLPGTLAFMERTIKQFTPYPFEYQFLNEHFDQLYKKEQRLGKIFEFFTILALLIASLGLFGLAAYAAEQRTKEIGMRKVLGATVASIVGLLSKDFLKLVLMGFVIAVPAAWYSMNRWLQDFAYHIEIGPGIFLLAGGVAILVALATVSWQSIRAALANPIKSIRYE